MRARLKLLILIVAAIVVGAFGFQHFAETNAAPAEPVVVDPAFEKPPSLLAWYGTVRLLALLALGITVANLAAIFVFDIVLKLVKVRVPTILRDLLIASVYIGMVLSLLSRVGVNLSGIIATSAVITAVIG